MYICKCVCGVCVFACLCLKHMTLQARAHAIVDRLERFVFSLARYCPECFVLSFSVTFLSLFFLLFLGIKIIFVRFRFDDLVFFGGKLVG